MFVYVEQQLAVCASHSFYGGGQERKTELLMVISVNANAHIERFQFPFSLNALAWQSHTHEYNLVFYNYIV